MGPPGKASLSRNPLWTSIPCTVPLFLYSLHALPVIYPRMIASMGKMRNLRTCMLLFRSCLWSSCGMLDGRSRERKCVRRFGTLWVRTTNQWADSRVKMIPLLGIPYCACQCTRFQPSRQHSEVGYILHDHIIGRDAICCDKE